MTHDDFHIIHFSATKSVDARLDYCAMAKQKQRFEGSHSTRTSGGEKNCSDIFHAAKIADWSATVPVAAIELHASEDACAPRPKVILRPAPFECRHGRPAPTSIRAVLARCIVAPSACAIGKRSQCYPVDAL